LRTPFVITFNRHDIDLRDNVVLNNNYGGHYVSSGRIEIVSHHRESHEAQVIHCTTVDGPKTWHIIAEPAVEGQPEQEAEDHIVLVLPPSGAWEPDSQYTIRLSEGGDGQSRGGEWTFRTPIAPAIISSSTSTAESNGTVSRQKEGEGEGEGVVLQEETGGTSHTSTSVRGSGGAVVGVDTLIETIRLLGGLVNEGLIDQSEFTQLKQMAIAEVRQGNV
jgi:hypothetical protein